MTRRSDKPKTTTRRSPRSSAAPSRKSGGFSTWQILLGLLAVIVLVAALYYRVIEIDFETGEITFPQDTPAGSPVPSTSVGQWYEVYFTQPAPDALYPEPQLVAAIDDARERVWVAVFDWDLEVLTEAMVRAHNRGVDVRLIVDTDNAGLAEIRRLQDTRVPVQDDLERTAFMHNKFMLIDDAEVWFGSLNLTRNDVRRNNNNFMRVFSFELNANFATEFGEMWEQQFGARSPANTPYPLLSFGESTLDVYFSPEDKPREELLRVVNGAQSEILFMAFSFTDEAVGSAMISAEARGVDVAGVIETFQSDGTGSQYLRLQRNGVLVRRDGNGGVMHHKVMIIDRRIVVTGSYNFTHSAYRNNDETLVIIDDSEVAAHFLTEYDRVWLTAGN